ncbi:Aste57867_13780 [Aphanomyces stellatus]|uniref:Aste57867_13780 protein n=1 Tax=Aphanomyces stellatus TaxID=120398 RepID=A0A485KZ10_9STRA|nr:hypothetical protein As57867_013730 [Aphanomyces stellatus]VFT90613.1 Aste57867_13780 [Aphanomyces stellatus]
MEPTRMRATALDMNPMKGTPSISSRPMKRKPLGTISQNVQAQKDERDGPTPCKKQKPIPTSATHENKGIPDATNIDETSISEEAEVGHDRTEELNVAWLDMCCALLDKKRSTHKAIVPTTDMSDFLLPEIQRPKKEPSTSDSTNGVVKAQNQDDVDPRDLDVVNAAKLLHEQSQPSSTCCGCKTGCLKLYCRCFLTRGFCTAQCTCVTCLNTQSSAQRLPAIITHLKNNIHAFRASTTATPQLSKNAMHGGDARALASASKFLPMVPNDHANAITCRCKKSKCSKKYCDCFQAGVACGPRCQCRDCCNHTPKETNTKQIVYAQDTIKVIVTRTPRQNSVATKSFRVHL